MTTTTTLDASPTTALSHAGLSRPQPGDRTPYDAYVAMPDCVLRGPDEPLPAHWMVVGHRLRHDGDHPVVHVHVRDAAFWHADGRPLGSEAYAHVCALWMTGRVKEPRRLLAALLPDFPALTGSALALLVVRVPVSGGRSLGLGYALDGGLRASVLWDVSGLESDRKHAMLVGTYGGQAARDAATRRHQRRLSERDSDLPTPTTRSEAIRLALERALGRTLREAFPCRPGGDLLDSLTGELRTVVEVNLDLLWDLDRDEARDFDPAHLHRWLPGYE